MRVMQTLAVKGATMSPLSWYQVVPHLYYLVTWGTMLPHAKYRCIAAWHKMWVNACLCML